VPINRDSPVIVATHCLSTRLSNSPVSVEFASELPDGLRFRMLPLDKSKIFCARTPGTVAGAASRFEIYLPTFTEIEN